MYRAEAHENENAHGDISTLRRESSEPHNTLLSLFRAGASDGPEATATEASAITPQGEITGIYRTADGRFHGYILSGDGFQTIDVPGAVNTETPTGGVWMSASGELAGYYQPQGAPPGQNRGWVRLADATFHTYLFPGSVDTCFFNINERGDLVGRYIADGVQHGLYVDRLGRRPPGQ